jgi:hypothetical protein
MTAEARFSLLKTVNHASDQAMSAGSRSYSLPCLKDLN